MYEAKGLHGMLPKTQTFFDIFDTYLSSPVVAQGAVYFGCGDGNLYALDIVTGEQRWKFQAGDVIHASPAYADGILYFGSWDSFFYAVDATTGKEKWRFKTGEDPVIHNQQGFQSSPAVADGVIYAGCRDAHLYAIDAATGKEKWNFSAGASWVITSPAVLNGKVIFGTSDTSLFYIFDAATGKEIIKQQAEAYLFSSPVVAGDVVLTGVLNGSLDARDVNTGQLLWKFETEITKQNPGWTLTAEKKLNDPMLYPTTWRENFTLGAHQQFALGIFSTPLVVNGVVYIGSNDGHLYAIE
jgi:outer membrane protein assembly factor BamB